MDGGTLGLLLARAKEGDADARNTLVEAHRSFIFNVVVSSCRRMLQWGRDDELSIGLIAFDEAVTRYEPERNVPFLAFARLVIKSRLANYFRQEVRRLSSGATNISEENLLDDTAAAWTEFLWDRSAQDRAEEIQDYEEALSEFGISLDELVHLSPKHRDSRMALIGAAKALAVENELFQRFGRKERLPVKKVSVKTGLSPKVIEKNRKYLLALAIIFRHPDRFIYLNSYIKR
ncbi:MAG: RNA polymerase sigma-I factor [Ammonifex sp.]|jgi:RNA polymerase sigma factor|nr:MAG: RNA polymerase sigma-I factor [Ammonifex sp.]